MFYHTPYYFDSLFPNLVWRIPTQKPVLYLTFDDGPHPEVTPWVLDVLDKFDAKGTFFCVGDNLSKHSSVGKKVASSGHLLANHTFHHIKGWGITSEEYQKDVALCENELVNIGTQNTLFRPPYGRITPSQVSLLSSKYKIIMWSVLSWDFKKNLNREKTLKILSKSQSGDIIVFHDSMKTFDNLKYLLPRFLEHFQQKGFRFSQLDL